MELSDGRKGRGKTMKDNQLKKAQEFVREKCEILNTFDDGLPSFRKHLIRISLAYLMFAFFRLFPDKPLRIDSSAPNDWGNLMHPKISAVKWKFLIESGEEATFEDQAEETQIAIATLLGYKTGGEDAN